MTNVEIKANELMAEALDKLIDKLQQKAQREREKVKAAYVTYKGEKYYSEADLMDAYACEMFSSETHDRLLSKLSAARDGVDPNEMTETEKLVWELRSRRGYLLQEIDWDKKAKEAQARKDARMQELVNGGCSYREAQVILGNEELTSQL